MRMCSNGLENLDSSASADGRPHMMGDESPIFHYGLDVEICIWIFDNLCRKKQLPGKRWKTLFNSHELCTKCHWCLAPHVWKKKYFVFYLFVLKVTLSGNIRLRDGHVSDWKEVVRSIIIEKEKSWRRVGLALSVFMENDVFLTTSFMTTERRWVTKQRFTPNMVL
jgi:hypothetical protein